MTDQELGPLASDPIDLELLRGWIGREQTAEDVLTTRLVDGLRATLDDVTLSPIDIPASIHWCLAPPIARQSDLGPDGHPNRGGFLPPVPLPRRMWAGSDVEFFSDLTLMDTLTRQSRVAEIEVKHGRTGPLVFVSVLHDWATSRGPALRELQKIVYRSAGIPRPPQVTLRPQPSHQRTVEVSETMLFRYSALTFNTHRIHYDRRYAIEVEGYAGLLVHGPLQASLLLEYATRLHGGLRPKGFSFKGVEPLLDGQTITLNASEKDKSLDLWCANADGIVTMEATAEWV